MKVFTDYLWFNTKKRQEFIRITDDIAANVEAAKEQGLDGAQFISHEQLAQDLRARGVQWD